MRGNEERGTERMGDKQKAWTSYLADHCVIIFHSEASLSPVYERPFSPLPAEQYTVRYQQGQGVSGKPDGLIGVNWEETVGNRDIDRFQRPALTRSA
jgi:hypothetical protein